MIGEPSPCVPSQLLGHPPSVPEEPSYISTEALCTKNTCTVVCQVISTCTHILLQIDCCFIPPPLNLQTPFTHVGLFDRDGNGTIDLKEFQLLWQYINQWKGVFDRYDRDRSGNIDVSELHTAFNEMGFRVSMAFCQLVVTRFDRLAKRSLKLDDFIQSCVMLRSLTEAFQVRDSNRNGIITVSYEDFMTMAISNKP